MTTKYKTNKRKLSSLVKQQVPEFVLTDHPKFAEFLSSYFLFMESAELNLDTFTDGFISNSFGSAIFKLFTFFVSLVDTLYFFEISSILFFSKLNKILVLNVNKNTK